MIPKGICILSNVCFYSIYFEEKPGKCPYFDESQRCDSSKKNECELDTDRASACSGDLICCAQPCGRKCVKPISGNVLCRSLFIKFA